jgi:hypothetical protein
LAVPAWKDKAKAAAASRAYRARNREAIRARARKRYFEDEGVRARCATYSRERADWRRLREPRGLVGLVRALRSFERFYFADALEAESAREAWADHVEWLESLDQVEG